MGNYQTPVSDLGDIVNPLRRQIDAVERSVSRNSQAPWIPANLINGFSYSSGFGSAAYYKDASGRVYWRGLVYCPNNITRPLRIFQLDEGYRPPHSVIMLVPDTEGGGALRMYVYTDGWVELYGGGVWLSNLPFDQLSFRTI